MSTVRAALAALACSASGAAAPSQPAVVWSVHVPAAGGGTSGPAFEESLASARRAHQPVLIDFYAEWCAACRLLDRSAFVSPMIIRETTRFVTIRVDTTLGDVEPTAIAARFGVKGLPTLVFLSSSGELLPSPRVVGTIAPDALMSELRKVR